METLNLLIQHLEKNVSLIVESYLLGPKDDLYTHCKYGYWEKMATRIIDSRHEFNPGLMAACSSGHMEMAQHMINSGAGDFYSALWGAVQSNDIKVVKFILSSDKFSQLLL